MSVFKEGIDKKMYHESTTKKIWRVIYPILLHIAIYFAVLLCGGFVLMGSGLAGEGTVGDVLTNYSAYLTAIALVITIPILYTFFRKDYAPKSNYIFREPKYLLSVIALGLLAAHGLSLLISLINMGGSLGDYSQVESVIFSSDLVMLLLRTVILAPLCEELMFRGLTFRRLKDYTNNFWIGALVSSAIFAIYHMNVPQGIFAFLFGIILCYVYDKFKNLWVPMIVHALGNVLSVVLTLAGANYPNMAVYIIAMVVALGLAFILYFYIIRKAEVTDAK